MVLCHFDVYGKMCYNDDLLPLMLERKNDYWTVMLFYDSLFL